MEVDVEGSPLDVGPRQRRSLLAALAVDAGTPVSAHTLVERLWGSRPPDAPRSTLYAYISRLKRALRVGPLDNVPVGISRRGDGYVLDADRASVDLHRFQALLETTKVAHAGRKQIALREAIDLWRGPPLLTLTSEWATRVRRGLESQLIGAAGTWAADELRRGNAAEVASVLARLVATYPLAEQLVALQMQALRAVDRTAEALQLYAETHAQLVELLGTGPGPELSGLHQTLLRGEPVRGRQGLLVRTGPDLVVPRQLPADVPKFIGRAEARDYLIDHLAPTANRRPGIVLVINGPPGVGKSALAVHAARQVADQYPDGQLYLDLRGSHAADPVDSREALFRLLLDLGVKASSIPNTASHAASLLRSTVAGRRILLVLDNAADDAQIRELLPVGDRCATIITCRRMLCELDTTNQLPLTRFAVHEALEMLAERIGLARVAAEPEAAVSIARLCEYLPLALHIAGTRIAARPGRRLGELRNNVADECQRLDNLDHAGMTIGEALAGFYRQLRHSPDPIELGAAEALPTLSTSQQRVLDAPAAANLLAKSVSEVEHLLERLVDHQLLDTPAPGIYHLGDLTRLYASEQYSSGVHRAAHFETDDRPH